MDQDVIDKLKYRAREIAHKIAATLPGDWMGYQWGEDLEWEIETDNSISFFRPGGARGYTKIRFNGISPLNITRKEIAEPSLTNQKIVDAQSTVVSNASDVEVTREYTFDASETKSYSENFGIGVEVGIKNKLSVGGDIYGAKAETELSLTISANYGKEWGGEETISKETSTKVVVPPHTEATVSTERRIANYEQRTRYWAGLNYQIVLYSHNDYRHEWGSIAELKQVLQGYGANTSPLAAKYRANPMNGTGILNITNPDEVDFESIFRFDKASSGNVNVTSRSL